MRKNILVTGGSGFIGTNLINYLNKNFIISNIDKISKSSTAEKFKKLSNKKYFFYKFNLKNKKKLYSLLKQKKFSTIIHLASESHVDRSIDDPYNFIEENILSTLSFYETVYKLLRLKKIKSPNIIHISTDEVFGNLNEGNAKENSPFNPSSPYAASKASGENIANSFNKTFGLRISIIRLCNNYGPYQFTEKFIPTCILKLINNRPIPIYGNGKNIREWIHVLDSCKAIEKLIKKFKTNQTYNIGSNKRVSNIKIANMISKVMKKTASIGHVKNRPAHDKRYSLNSSKFKKEFKWFPKLSLNEGIRNTVEWYINNNTWVKECLKKYKGERLGKI
jgi:dTDP-glucose 4,6-dehydratase